MAVGTPAYMSPEQAAGDEELDGRSDVHALGCVLYEMLAGQPLFTGPTFESLARQHLTAEPRRITQLRPAVPAEVAAALERALAKTPADRFNPVAQFGDAIPRDRLATGASAARVSRASGRGRRIVRLSAAVAVLALIAVAVTLAVSRRGSGGASVAASVAVLPFVDLSPDRSNAYLGDGTAETLISALANVEGLEVAARTSAFSFRDSNEDVREIGRELGVATVLEGSAP